ncbi:hypothetical protein [uncultured Slackia sp.]|uniref:hypothetical protein n=1 Tax=uncultured Slackia sp. TaxID=665903 RepID=UPI0025CBD484|nr:hypothetical protein [uncultured Slackia sp.]
MPICLSHQSALEYLRASDERDPHLLSAPRTGKIEGTTIANAEEALAEASLQFFLERPVHLLVASDKNTSGTAGVVRHVNTSPLPRRAVIQAMPSLFVAAPEFVFLQMASLLSEADAILLGFELCGSYVPDVHDMRGFRIRDPLTNMRRIGAFLNGCSGQRGVHMARKALAHVVDGSASPMETAMAVMLTFPTRLGGMGFERPELNKEIVTEAGVRKIDLLWPRLKFGLEYNGRPYHAGEQAHERDERRKNAILASGVELMTVYYKDIAQSFYFDQLVSRICKATHQRRRVRVKDFKFRQSLLRAKVLPALRSSESWMASPRENGGVDCLRCAD